MWRLTKIPERLFSREWESLTWILRLISSSGPMALKLRLGLLRSPTARPSQLILKILTLTRSSQVVQVSSLRSTISSSRSSRVQAFNSNPRSLEEMYRRNTFRLLKRDGDDQLKRVSLLGIHAWIFKLP